MAQYRRIINTRTGGIVLERAKWCASFWCHFRGLQLVASLPESEGLLFVTGNESKSGTSIHMLFMLMSIGVIWVNEAGIVVDKKFAKPWRLAYVPQAPAMFYIEAAPTILDTVEVGDALVFEEHA